MTKSKQLQKLIDVNVQAADRLHNVAEEVTAGVARAFHFEESDIANVREITGLLCRDVVENHFDTPGEASFTLAVKEHHGSLIIRIEDRGLPYPIEPFHSDDKPLAEHIHDHSSLESIRFEDCGVKGNAIEFKLRQIPDSASHLQESENNGNAASEVSTSINIRRFKDEDGRSLARCIYRCYGYTYANDFLYYPQQVKNMIKDDLLRSFVSIDTGNRVVGHIGLKRDHKNAAVAESGMAVVDPHYRGHHIFSKLKKAEEKAIDEMNLSGIYADAVTVHPYTQKANAQIGAHETGIMLAEIPGFTRFEGFDNKENKRRSVVVYFRKVAPAPTRTVYVPNCYRNIFDMIYEPLQLDRSMNYDAPSYQGNETSVIHTELKKRRSLARMEVESCGVNLLQQVQAKVKKFCIRGYDVIHLDIPLSDPHTVALVDSFAELGFLFSAIIPEYYEGDTLRLQYLNNIKIGPDDMVLYTDRSKKLLEAILE